jgi:hypothetical protein
MCKKSLIALLLFFCCERSFSQDTTAVATEPAFDSAAVLSDLMALLDSADNPVSYGLVSMGMGNRLFSVRNNRLNARQSSTSLLVLSPLLGYFHKSGFSISAGSSFLNDPAKGFGPTQYSITPAWDLAGNQNWGAGISYSRYVATDKYSVYASPIQHDVFAYASYKKWWIEPGITAGYSTGQYREINTFTVQATGNTYIDTGTYTLKAFSFTAMAGHDFEWQHILSKNDALGFTLFPNLLRFLQLRNRLPRLSGKNSFSAQSVALNLDLSYAVGNFTVLPQLYLDYFLPATEEKRFTQTFTLGVGYSF